MAKKFFAKLGLGIMIGLMMAPIAFADQTADQLIKLAAPYGSDLKSCINELIPNTQNPDKPTPGPDDGYVISIMEEPLNIAPSKIETSADPKPDYVVRRCFRNTFQYTEIKKDDSTPPKETHIPHTVAMLADKCSNTAQGLMPADPKTDPYFIQYSCKEVTVVLTKGGASAIYGYINMIYRWGASMVGIIAVTVIIVSGIQISASGGDSEAIGSAKKRIIQSIVGIIVLFLASLILYTINPTFFVNG